jgi:hypothetical protein
MTFSVNEHRKAVVVAVQIVLLDKGRVIGFQLIIVKEETLVEHGRQSPFTGILLGFELRAAHGTVQCTLLTSRASKRRCLSRSRACRSTLWPAANGDAVE